MRRALAHARFLRTQHCFVLCMALWTADFAWAQSDQAHQHIFLPPVSGGTPLSFQIQSEAAYVAAYGDMMESAAIARKVNAQAVALEIQNSVAYVDAYFKRRDLNRQWRSKEDPNYLEREKRHQEVFKRRVEEQYQDVQRGDVTKTLNWLLRELADPVVAYQYLPANQTCAVRRSIACSRAETWSKSVLPTGAPRLVVWFLPPPMANHFCCIGRSDCAGLTLLSPRENYEAHA